MSYFEFSLVAQEQSKYGFELKTYLQEVEPHEMVPLLVEANDENRLKEIIENYGGTVRLQIEKLFSIDLPAFKVNQFSKDQSVKQIEFSTAKGQALSDTMLIQTNTDSVHRGSSPFTGEYSGKGVLLGVIDSGIELLHPDFQDENGNTRILYVWDQGVSFNPARPAGNYNYGVEWDSASINARIATHDDKATEFGHGSNVTGAAASNGLASGNFKGVAPEANIISVATDFNKANWLQTVVEAVDYIYQKADSLNMPCVINASIGTYLGSHDGKDIAARMIDALIKEKDGRAFVCAAGNAGTIDFHLQHKLRNDTAFTWFRSNPFMWSNLGGLFFTFWADSIDFDSLQFAIGADRVQNGNYQFRGRTAFDSIQNRLNQIHTDSIVGFSGNRIAEVKTYAEKNQGRYKVEIAIIQPDSSNYLFRLETIGTGKLDLWSSYQLIRHSDMVSTNLPSISQYPEMVHYQKPDTHQTIVSSFTCLPSVITVGNYTNRASYIDVSNTMRTINVTPGEISPNSSLGPNRLGRLKPDISSAGDYMFAAGRLATITSSIINNPAKVSQDSLHFRNGGTSMASPTVAGMVALYLEMCPTANYNQILTDLKQTAKEDHFTFSLPNNKWGVGKADAFQFLKRRLFQVNTIIDSPPYCDGDTIILSGSNQQFSYWWNTSDSSQSIKVSESGSYYAIAKNNYGCLSATDTQNIDFNPLPNKPIIQQSGNQLNISENGQYQWFLNQIPIQQATSDSLIVQQNGDYFCELTDSNGCRINSDTVNIVITSLEKRSKNQIKLYPNPSNGQFIVEFNEPKATSIELYSIKGRLIAVKEWEHPKQQVYLNWSPISPGIYLLKINSREHMNPIKLIIK